MKPSGSLIIDIKKYEFKLNHDYSDEGTTLPKVSIRVIKPIAERIII